MTAVAASTTAPRTAAALPFDTVLGALERAAARLPHAAAVPVMAAHATIATVAYR
ncbi:hypothetical protein [Curtobacterium sp. 9128]|uniref:hypothetical protein n=1 Tax=Curtobacterium sp. 9128 TaxID=1793722 RepID=UPI001642C755|nr:hypothetical protein [Curtobacterium sp. 9128]